MTSITYYEQPLLKKPVWVWSIPTYFYAGAAAGASLALGAATQLLSPESTDLVQRCRWIGAAGITAGTGLLIYDLGKPSRFYNMLRVFRPSSPMNVGSWLLAGTGSLAAAAVVGPVPSLKNSAAIAAGLLGIPLSGYTGVLLANTAVPVWQTAGRALPVFFIASGMARAGALFHLMELSERDERIARNFAIAGQAAELACMFMLEREVSRVERVAEPLKKGRSGFLWKAARTLGAASLMFSLFSRKSQKAKTAAGVCGTAAALSLRFALLQAGRNSAHDPHATLDQQRRGELPQPEEKEKLLAVS
jgi:formate-dependent nitrite reductase membrane component NrfD